MSGPRRAAVFVSAIWLVGWVVLNGVDLSATFKWDGFLIAAVLPLALVWGIWWVVAGFRQKAVAGTVDDQRRVTIRTPRRQPER